MRYQQSRYGELTVKVALDGIKNNVHTLGPFSMPRLTPASFDISEIAISLGAVIARFWPLSNNTFFQKLE